ncbi:MAG: RNA polymerase-binding protein RbpA [bacterium]
MSEGTLRGTRLGATSYENDEHVAPAERVLVSYDCPRGHTTVVPFSAEAEEIPVLWECRCGAEGLQREASRPDAKAQRPARTHWDMLMERRTLDDLEELLVERLDLLRDARKSA